MNKRTMLQLIGLLFCLMLSAAGAQTPLPIDLKLMTSGEVFAVAAQADGKIVIGGDFTRVNGVERNRIARLNSDGTLDTTWNPSANGPVRALAVDATTIYAGGDYSSIGGTLRSNIAALDMTTGSATAWNPGTNGTVRALQLDGTAMYVGGAFSQAGGAARSRIASLSTASDAANAWNPGANGDVRTFAIKDNMLLVGGSFSSIETKARNRIAAFDRSNLLLDSWNPDFNGDVHVIVADVNRIYVGGAFTTINALARNRLASFNGSTVNPDAWNPNVNGDVYALQLAAPRLYVAGFFSGMSAQQRFNLAAVDALTGALETWNPGVNGAARAITLAGSTIYAGGAFTQMSGQPRLGIAAIGSTGSPVPGVPHVGRAGSVYAVAAQGDSKIVAGGDFLVAHTGSEFVGRAYILRLGNDGVLDPAWNPGAQYLVQALAVDATRVYAGGQFNSMGGLPRDRLAAIEIATGNVASWNPGADGSVLALAHRSGTVYAGGSFTNIGGQARARIAALSASTGLATAWNPGADGEVIALAASASAIYAGGGFATAGGQARSRVAAIDPATGSALAFNPGANNIVQSLALDASTLYVGGSFSQLGGEARFGLGAVDAASGVATTWDPQASATLGIAKRGSLVYAGGSFIGVGAEPRDRLGAISASTGLPDAWNPGANGEISALISGGNVIVAGGSFTQAGGLARDGFVILPVAGPTDAVLNVLKSGNGSGTVTGSAGGIDCGAVCGTAFPLGTSITLTATPAPGSVFVGWTGPCSGTGTCTLVMLGSQSVSAVFGSSFVLQGNILSGQGTISSTPAGLACGPTCFADFPAGTVATITPNPAPGFFFLSWSGDCTGSGACNITMNGNRAVAASFGQYAVLFVTTSGSGQVTSVPAGINCPGDCEELIIPDTVVTLTATPATGRVFTGWGGACSGTGTCELTMTSSKTVSATFTALPALSVTVNLDPQASGSVSSNPAGIACPGDCAEYYASGTVVTLTANIPADSYLKSWGGACSGTGACQVTLSANVSVTANIGKRPILTVTRAGDGSGTVTSNPNGINCGNDCTQDYLGQVNPSVTLTADPAGNSMFGGWSGDGCSGTATTCTVTMNQARNITATFFRPLLTVTKAGNGTGTVTGPGGLNCGSTCTLLPPPNSQVTLTATPAPGSAFTGWSGDCTGMGTCTVTMNQATRNVEATFLTGAFSMDIQGQGTVTSSPAGIQCPTTCAFTFAYGTSITLTAAPAPGWKFVSWGDNFCSNSTAPTCTITLNQDGMSELAIFAEENDNPALPDFNADNKPDLLWRHTPSGALYVWYMNGITLTSDQLVTTVDPSWKLDGIADFNGDGHPDIVWRNGAGDTYVWYLVNGVFQSDAYLFSLPPEWVIQGVADFNADGKPDFLMRNVNSGNAFAWFFNNNAPIGDQFLFNIDPSWKVEGVADLNADGQPDLLFRNTVSGLAFAWNSEFTGGTLSLTTSSPPIFAIDSFWEIVQVADWNDDGKPDLVFRNRDTGVVFVWYLDGVTLTTSDFIIQIDPSWEIVPRR